MPSYMRRKDWCSLVSVALCNTWLGLVGGRFLSGGVTAAAGRWWSLIESNVHSVIKESQAALTLERGGHSGTVSDASVRVNKYLVMAHASQPYIRQLCTAYVAVSWYPARCSTSSSIFTANYMSPSSVYPSQDLTCGCAAWNWRRAVLSADAGLLVCTSCHHQGHVGCKTLLVASSSTISSSTLCVQEKNCPPKHVKNLQN